VTDHTALPTNPIHERNNPINRDETPTHLNGVSAGQDRWVSESACALEIELLVASAGAT
jgi:hypothetical protein